MSFIRPDAAETLLRWREVIVGALVLITGAWWAFGLGGLLFWIGGVVMLGGAALIVAGIQRARFRIPGGGPGVVQVTEGQIAYYGPLTGGAVALSELSKLSIQAGSEPSHWVLSQPGTADLYIPVTAEGAETLFDAFAHLPGLRTEHMLAQMKGHAPTLVTIWERPDQPNTAPPRLLH